MLGLNNAGINQLEAENHTLRVELDAANARANALRTALCQAWREHGVLPPAPDVSAAGVVTAESAMQRLCWN